MSGDSELGETPIGSVALSLGKLEAWAEQSRDQSKRDADQRERILDALGKLREDYAGFSSQIKMAISQLGNASEDHEARISDLEKAHQQIVGASKLGGAIGHGASAVLGGAIVWALQNLQRLFGH